MANRGLCVLSFLTILASLTLGAAAAVAADRQVGYLAAVQGTAEILRAGAILPANQGVLVNDDDHLRTGPDARILLVLNDGSRIVVGSDTRVALLLLVGAGAAIPEMQLIDLLQGIMRIGVHQSEDGTAVQTRSPTAVVAARSTEWIMEFAADSTAVLALAGSVIVTPQAGHDPVVLGPGYGTDVPADAPARVATEWGAARVADVRARTAFGGTP